MSKLFYFLKNERGEYLQAQWDRTTKRLEHWFDVQRAWAPAFDTLEAAEDYRRGYALEYRDSSDGPLTIHAEPLLTPPNTRSTRQ